MQLCARLYLSSLKNKPRILPVHLPVLPASIISATIAGVAVG